MKGSGTERVRAHRLMVWERSMHFDLNGIKLKRGFLGRKRPEGGLYE